MNCFACNYRAIMPGSRLRRALISEKLRESCWKKLVLKCFISSGRWKKFKRGSRSDRNAGGSFDVFAVGVL